MNAKLFFVAAAMLSLVATASAATCPSIEQYGITWTFQAPYPECGQFVTDDWWVVGPVTIIGIDPPSLDIGGRIKNGSMINPPIGNVIGYDNQSLDDAYSAALNVAFNVSGSNPLTVPVNSSLISTISLDQPFQRPQVDSAAILTVLQSAAPEGSFRPPYVGTDKTIRFNKSDLDYTKLKKLPRSSVQYAPSLAEPYGPDVAIGAYPTPGQWFNRPCLDHGTEDPGRDIHPVKNCPDYGRDISRYTIWAGLLLNFDFEDSEKESLLIGLVQYGLDLYRIVSLNPTSFVDNGTITSGRLLPILLAGVVLDDAPGAEAIRDTGQKTGQYRYTDGYYSGNLPPDYIHFLETDQTHYVTQMDIDITNNLISGIAWNPDDRDYADVPYSQADFGLPEWGIRNSRSPQQNNNIWDTAYRSSSGAVIAGTALVAQIMGIQDLFNSPAMFDFADRYVAYLFPAGSSGYDLWWNSTGRYITVSPPRDVPQQPEALQFGPNGFEFYKNAPFVLNMWNAYRGNYGCTYKSLNTATHTRIYDCAGTTMDCKDISTCGQYPNQRATDYDPCHVCSGTIPSQCSGTSTSCGTYPNCTNCDASDGCIGTSYRDYYCSGTSCNYAETANAPMCQQATGELKLWLKFDTGMQDASGNGNNASCSGTGCPALLPTGGHDGKGAYLFDGIDDYLELPAAAGFGMQETNQYTITAWAKPNSANGNIMQKGQYFYPFMVQFTDGVVRAGTRTANTSYIYSNTSPATGQWHHLAVTYTNGERVLYINGVADNQDSPSGGLNVMGEKTTIGGWTNSSYFSGTIDDIRVYNTILGGAEILAIYQGTETECVDGTALANYLAQWKAGDISIPMLMQKIAQWKAGTGC